MDLEQLSKDLYFAKEAAEYLGISMQRLNQLVHDGKIVPLKKSPSGTIFHISELEQRKEELRIFNKTILGGDRGMFLIDTGIKQEALNFATLMNILDWTENKLDPKFEAFGQKIDLSLPLIQDNVCSRYALEFQVSEKALKETYLIAAQAFSKLRDTDEIIKRGSLDYPPLLSQTEQAPRFLYIRGKKSLLYEKRTVALVGSRNASDAAKDNTRRVAEALGKNGITVVSGLAKGIDVTAHSTALKWGYNTIAVIGTNLNQYYPKENRHIQEAIERKGLIVSQFSPAAKTQRWFFPLRNGVMSGLSLATVIMEAGETSGALRQADFALKQGRQILIPEKALEIPTITWPARYVKRGAKTVRTPMDILRELSENRIYKADGQYIQQSFGEYPENSLQEDSMAIARETFSL